MNGRHVSWSLLACPKREPGLQPSHVPWLGIKLMTLPFTGWCSNNWTTPARQEFHFLRGYKAWWVVRTQHLQKLQLNRSIYWSSLQGWPICSPPGSWAPCRDKAPHPEAGDLRVVTVVGLDTLAKVSAQADFSSSFSFSTVPLWQGQELTLVFSASKIAHILPSTFLLH